MSEGVGDLLFFVASFLPVGWGISKVLTFVDERGLRRVSGSMCFLIPKGGFKMDHIKVLFDLYFFQQFIIVLKSIKMKQIF